MRNSNASVILSEGQHILQWKIFHEPDAKRFLQNCNNHELKADRPHMHNFRLATLQDNNDVERSSNHRTAMLKYLPLCYKIDIACH